MPTADDVSLDLIRATLRGGWLRRPGEEIWPGQVGSRTASSQLRLINQRERDRLGEHSFARLSIGYGGPSSVGMGRPLCIVSSEKISNLTLLFGSEVDNSSVQLIVDFDTNRGVPAQLVVDFDTTPESQFNADVLDRLKAELRRWSAQHRWRHNLGSGPIRLNIRNASKALDPRLKRPNPYAKKESPPSNEPRRLPAPTPPAAEDEESPDERTPPPHTKRSRQRSTSSDSTHERKPAKKSFQDAFSSEETATLEELQAALCQKEGEIGSIDRQLAGVQLEASSEMKKSLDKAIQIRAIEGGQTQRTLAKVVAERDALVAQAAELQAQLDRIVAEQRADERERRTIADSIDADSKLVSTLSHRKDTLASECAALRSRLRALEIAEVEAELINLTARVARPDLQRGTDALVNDSEDLKVAVGKLSALRAGLVTVVSQAGGSE